MPALTCTSCKEDNLQSADLAKLKRKSNHLAALPKKTLHPGEGIFSFTRKFSEGRRAPLQASLIASSGSPVLTQKIPYLACCIFSVLASSQKHCTKVWQPFLGWVQCGDLVNSTFLRVDPKAFSQINLHFVSPQSFIGPKQNGPKLWSKGPKITQKRPKQWVFGENCLLELCNFCKGKCFVDFVSDGLVRFACASSHGEIPPVSPFQEDLSSSRPRIREVIFNVADSSDVFVRSTSPYGRAGGFEQG